MSPQPRSLGQGHSAYASRFVRMGGTQPRALADGCVRPAYGHGALKKDINQTL